MSWRLRDCNSPVAAGLLLCHKAFSVHVSPNCCCCREIDSDSEPLFTAISSVRQKVLAYNAVLLLVRGTCGGRSLCLEVRAPCLSLIVAKGDKSELGLVPASPVKAHAISDATSIIR